MNKMRVFVLALILILAAGSTAWGVIYLRQPAPVIQPIHFNHQRHMKESLACEDCHKQVASGPHATLPALKTCLLCHKEAKGTHPDEPKIRKYAEEGHEIPWQQVNRLPGHVYFSHAAHVKYAKMDCLDCHGETRERSEPVTTSQIGHLTMSKCMACHEEKKVSNDCLVCHK